MALSRAKKTEKVQKLASELEHSTSAIIGTFKGLTASKDFDLRKTVRAAGGSYHVVKNKLAARAGAGHQDRGGAAGPQGRLLGRLHLGRSGRARQGALDLGQGQRGVHLQARHRRRQGHHASKRSARSPPCRARKSSSRSCSSSSTRPRSAWLRSSTPPAAISRSSSTRRVEKDKFAGAAPAARSQLRCGLAARSRRSRSRSSGRRGSSSPKLTPPKRLRRSSSIAENRRPRQTRRRRRAAGERHRIAGRRSRHDGSGRGLNQVSPHLAGCASLGATETRRDRGSRGATSGFGDAITQHKVQNHIRRNNMADIQQLEDQIVSLSLLEASALVKKLEERLGVSAAAAVAAAPAAGGGGQQQQLRSKRRPSSPSSSRMPARTRSPPSRLYAKSPPSA